MDDANKIRILFLITDLGKGGAERYLIDLCEELRKHPNIDFILATLLPNNDYEHLTQHFKIEQLGFQPFSFRSNNENECYQRLLKEFKPHIVHTHRFLAEFLSSYYVNRDIVYVCHGHDSMVQLIKPKLSDFFSKQKVFNAWERYLLIRNKYRKALNYFIANSDDTWRFFKKNLPSFMQKQIRYIPLGFNYERFYSGYKTIAPGGRKIRILNVGSFQEKKNQRFLIDIALQLRSRNVDFEITMIGTGEHFNSIRGLVAKHKLAENVSMPGMIHNVEEWYKSSDLYVHTAYYEPFGLVLLEAMASGTPVISLDGKGNRNLIENGVTGFMIKEQDAAKFAERIQTLIGDEKLYQHLSKKGVAFSKEFDARERTKELILFYQEILSSRDCDNSLTKF